MKWTTCMTFIQYIDCIQLSRNREYEPVKRILQKHHCTLKVLKDAVSSIESKHCIGSCQDDLCFKMGSHIKLYRKVKTNHLRLPTPSILYITVLGKKSPPVNIKRNQLHRKVKGKHLLLSGWCMPAIKSSPLKAKWFHQLADQPIWFTFFVLNFRCKELWRSDTILLVPLATRAILPSFLREPIFWHSWG